MKIVMFILAVLSVLMGCLFFAVAKSAIHEIEGLMCFIIFSISLGTGFILAKMEEK